MITLVPANAKGVLGYLEYQADVYSRPDHVYTTLPEVHEVKSGKYELSDADSLFPEDAFNGVPHDNIVSMNIIKSNGELSLYGGKKEENETFGTAIFKAIKMYESYPNCKEISGIVIRYKRTMSSTLQLIPFFGV